MEKKSPTPISGRMFLRPQDIADMTGLSRAQVYVEITNGSLKASKLGPKSIVITPEDFQSWIDSTITPIMREMA